MLSYWSKLNKMEYTFLKDKILFNKVLDAVPKKLFHTFYGSNGGRINIRKSSIRNNMS